MRHFEHLSNSEVAQALNLSDAAAGMRYLRAMRKLRAQLDEKGEQDVSSGLNPLPPERAGLWRASSSRAGGRQARTTDFGDV